jgi:acetylornithine deacetylase/succinyl-diaminopimelate desuccinylase-like protein
MSAPFTPAAYSLSPGYAATILGPAINAVKNTVKNTNFEELRKNPKHPATAIESDILLPLLKDISVSLENVRCNYLIKLGPQEAQDFLNGVIIPEKVVAEFRIRISRGTPPSNASEIEQVTFNLAKIILGILDDLDLFANSAPVDEKSDDYQAFLNDLAEEASNEGKRTYGKKNLMALFED